jgi:hypothetical protein
MKRFFSRIRSSPSDVRCALKNSRVASGHSSQDKKGRTIASMYTSALIRSGCRCAHENPRAEPQSWRTRVTLRVMPIMSNHASR